MKSFSAGSVIMPSVALNANENGWAMRETGVSNAMPERQIEMGTVFF
jgi:hypothetical protein